MQRYFISSSNIDLPYLYITGEDFHHITHVMRMKIGDKVYVSDNNVSYLAKIDNFEENRVVLSVIEELHEEKELPYQVTIAQGLIRKEKMEMVIDFVTEMGASSYLPVLMERSIVKMDNDKMDKKMERLSRIAKEASEQSHRVKVLEVLPLVSFNDFLKMGKHYDLCLYAYEDSKKQDSLKKILKNKKYQNILILIGPEGGISEKEVKLLKDNNFLPIKLGPRILRTQVAPLYIMGALSYEWEDNDD